MEIREEEKKYLDKNSKYYIEQTLLNSLSKDDLKNFINPIYKEYEELKKIINNKVEEIFEEYKNIDELSKYFIEVLVYMDNWWDSLEKLEDALKIFNTHLYTRLPNKKWYRRDFKRIDINNIPIKNVISKYIKLPDNLMKNIKCPIHEDKTPSFRIYKETNSFYCFWCGRWWNAINFIAEIENISNKEAFKKFIDYFNM